MQNKIPVAKRPNAERIIVPQGLLHFQQHAIETTLYGWNSYVKTV
jgi:hypothetical protein